MGFTEGVVWSLAGAVAHSAIDVLRKLGSQRMAPADLVALVTVFDAIIATVGVYVVEGSLPDPSTFISGSQFFAVVSITSALAVLARLLYQRALSIAPLSLTVPYLAFTPAFVVLISPMFLVGEVPSPVGMLGVFVVSISGYMLGLVTAPGNCDQPGSPSKSRIPLAVAPVRKSVSTNTLQQLQQQQQEQKALLLQDSHPQQHHNQQQNRFQEEWRDHNHHRISDGNHSSSRSKSRGSQMSVWAMAYYKGKAPQSAVGSATAVAAPANLHPADGAPAGPTHWHLSSDSKPLSSSTAYDSSAAIRVVANSSSNWSSGDSDPNRWDDSQAKLCKDTSKADSKAAVGRPPVGLASHRAGRLMGHSSRHSGLGERWFGSWGAVLSVPTAAPAMVLTVAFLYSMTASLDKLGIAAANHSLSAYFLGQRLLIGICGAVYLVLFARSALRHIVTDMWLLCSISVVEQAAVVFYLMAIDNILVSYVVAIKRVNVLLSTLVGCLLFKEHVRKRIPYIVVMLCGMLMIVLQPGHEDLHHSHHTRLLQHRVLMLL